MEARWHTASKGQVFHGRRAVLPVGYVFVLSAALAFSAVHLFIRRARGGKLVVESLLQSSALVVSHAPL